MKLLESSKSKINKDENAEKWGSVEVVIVHGSTVSNDYQYNSRALHTFVPNKSFGQLLYILPKKFIVLKIFNSEISYIEVWLINQYCKPLEIEYKKILL